MEKNQEVNNRASERMARAKQICKENGLRCRADNLRLATEILLLEENKQSVEQLSTGSRSITKGVKTPRIINKDASSV
jgi:hypothetical protein